MSHCPHGHCRNAMSRPATATMIAQITMEPSMPTALPHRAIECSHFPREPKPHQTTVICHHRIITVEVQSCLPLLHPSFSPAVPQCPLPRKPRRPVPGELNQSFLLRSRLTPRSGLLSPPRLSQVTRRTLRLMATSLSRSAHLLGKGSRSSKCRLVEPARPRSAS